MQGHGLFCNQWAAASDLSASLCQMPGLTHLDLRRNGIDDAVLDLIAPGLGHLVELKHLDLSGNTLRAFSLGGSAKGSVPWGLAPLAAVEVLHLSENAIEDCGIMVLSRYLSGFSNLRAISLAENRCEYLPVREWR